MNEISYDMYYLLHCFPHLHCFGALLVMKCSETVDSKFFKVIDHLR